MIPKQARLLLTTAQVETIETNPLYPVGLSSVSYDGMSGDVEVTFGPVRFQVTPEGRVKAPRAQNAQGVLSQQADEIEAQIEALQRTVEELVLMVRTLMTHEQRMRCPQGGEIPRFRCALRSAARTRDDGRGQ